MKKFIAIALALMMMMSAMAVPAFAAVQEPLYEVYIMDSTATSNLAAENTVAVGGEFAVKIYIRTPGNGDTAKFTINVPDFMSVSSVIHTGNSGYTVDYAVENGVLTGTTTIDTTGNVLTVLKVDSIPAEGVSFNFSDFSPTVQYLGSSYITISDVTWKGDSATLAFSAAAGATELTVATATNNDSNTSEGEGDSDGDTSTSTPDGEQLTGEVSGDVTISEWNNSDDSLVLGNDYFIPVTGVLDSDGDGEDDTEDDTTDLYIDVRVYWTDMIFNYTYEWDTTTLAEKWYWENGKDNIKVENWSNVDVNAAISFTGANGYNNDAVTFENVDDAAVGATWADNVLSLEHGNQIADYADADTDNDGVVAPSGTLNVNVADVTMDTGDDADKEVTLGYITITITAEGADNSGSGSTVETVTTLEMETSGSSYTFDVAANEALTLIVNDSYYGNGNVVDKTENFVLKNGETTLTSGTDYTWDASTGTLTILDETLAGSTLTLNMSANGVSMAAVTEPESSAEETPAATITFALTITLNVH